MSKSTHYSRRAFTKLAAVSLAGIPLLSFQNCVGSTLTDSPKKIGCAFIFEASAIFKL